MIEVLPRVVPAEPGKPTRPEAAASQRESRAIAERPDSWTPSAADKVVRRYTELAPSWDGDRGGYRSVPLSDALRRGGPFPAGLCVEVGSGTGLLTPLLIAVWPDVLCLDLTPEMLHRSPAPWRIHADASRLPLPDAAATTVVLADVPLFAPEVARVLAANGTVVWSNALGEDAPHHVPIPVVTAALTKATNSQWTATTSEAGWGLWAVLARR